MKSWLKGVWAALCGGVEPNDLPQLTEMQIAEAERSPKTLVIEPGETKFALIGARDLLGEPLVILRVDQAQMIEVDGDLRQIIPFEPEGARTFALSMIECAPSLSPILDWGEDEQD